MAGSLRGRAAVSYAAGESQREFDSLTCHKFLMCVDYMAKHSDRPKPSSTTTTMPVMQPLRRTNRHSGSMKASKPSLGSAADAPKSECVVCGGEVVDSEVNVETSTRHSMQKIGYHCSKCGIAYMFLPPKLRRK